MFVILNIVESGKRKIKRGKTVSHVQEVSTSGGERFYIVDVCDSEKGVNWDEVSYFIGKHSKKVLLDRQFSFPEFTPLVRFEAMHFRNLLLFNTLELILREMYLSGLKIRCIINDPLALYSSCLSKTVRFASHTTVVTNCDYRYFSEVQGLYNEYGAGVTVCEKAPAADDGTFIIDTSCSFENNGKGYLFSVSEGITPLTVEGFSHLKVLCPSYIDSIDFLGAVYEMNRDNSLAQAFCADFLFYGERKSVSEVMSELKSRLSTSFDSNKSIIFCV